MIHHFKYTLKTLFKNKPLIFWTFAFPIILATFFYMAFSNIENSEQLDIIDIAIVDNEQYQQSEAFKEAFKTLSDETSSQHLFNTKYVSLSDAKTLLEEDKIDGYLLLLDEPKIVVTSSGINETILKYVVEQILQVEDILFHAVEDNINQAILNHPDSSFDMSTWYQEIYQEVMNLMNKSVAIEDISSQHLSYTMIEFYTLIAMTCLYGGILGMVAMNQTLANMSNNGKRIAVSPTPKATLIVSSVIAGYLVQLVGVALLFIYTIFVLHVDYGNNFLLVILFTLVGSLAGLTMGIAIASAIRTNENLKTGIMLAITMFGCFLSGMMGITMKYIVDKNIPLLNQLNPANMITDGFYSLYYYKTYHRFYFNMGSLIVFSLVMVLISIFSLRRQKYDSI